MPDLQCTAAQDTKKADEWVEHQVPPYTQAQVIADVQTYRRHYRDACYTVNGTTYSIYIWY